MQLSSMRVLAANFGLEKIEAICVKATLTLEEGEKLEGNYSVIQETKSEADRFDSAVEGLNAGMERMRKQLVTVPAAERPAIERAYVDILKDLYDAAPDTLQGTRLGREPSNKTPYNEAFVVDKDVIRHSQFAQILEDQLSGLGISTDEMRERLLTGADNDELASIWAERDAATIAEARGLDLDNATDQQAVQRYLTDIYEEMRLDLLQYRAASVTPEFRELSRAAERQDGDVYPPYAALRSPAEMQAAYDTLRDTIEGDPRNPEAVRAYLDDTTPDLSDDERQRLADDLSGMARAAEFRRDQEVLRDELREANVPPHLVDAGLSVHRDENTDDVYKAAVPSDFVRGLGRDLREELQIDRPTVEDFSAHVKNEAPDLREETREDLARRLHGATYLPAETVARDDRPAFSTDDSRRMVADVDRNLAAGIRPTDTVQRADVAKIVRDSLNKDELDRLERGDAQALGKLTQNPAIQKVMAFEYLHGEVATGRTDLVQPMQRFNNDVQHALDLKVQNINDSTQKHD